MRSARAILALALSAFVGFGVLPTAKADTTESEHKAEVRLFEAINNFRVNKGLAPLIEHAFIRDQAREHAQRMSDQGVLSHTGFNARTVKISHDDAGIAPEKICENVASSPLPGAGKTAKATFRAWKASVDHRACMLGPADYTTQSGAVGAEYDGNTWWIVFIAAHDDTP
jgi:uncharacterized protein YkwD